MRRTALACCTALALTAGAAAAQPVSPQTMSCGIGIGKPCPTDPQGVLLERLARDHPLPKPVVRKTVLQAEYGGEIDQHWQRFQQLAMNGDEVELRGQCESACTLVMIVPKDRLCFGKAAYLAFHQARRLTGDAPLPEATRWMIDKYPAEIRTWIEARGGIKKMPLVGYWITYAPELWTMGYRRCND